MNGIRSKHLDRKKKNHASKSSRPMRDDDSNRLCELAHEFESKNKKKLTKNEPIHIYCRYFDDCSILSLENRQRLSCLIENV